MNHVPEGAFTAHIGQLTVHIGIDTAVIEGPPAPGEPRELPGTPAALREWARLDALGRYRPLSGARTLRGGWFARFSALRDLDEALDAIYPLAQAHLAEFDEGSLRVVPLDAVLERQTGRYASSAKLSDTGRVLACDVLCGRCVRTPVWPLGHKPAVELEDTLIPCPEPCSVFVALCREAAAWEQDSPPRAARTSSVPFAAFEEPGNEIREDFLEALEAIRG